MRETRRTPDEVSRGVQSFCDFIAAIYTAATVADLDHAGQLLLRATRALGADTMSNILLRRNVPTRLRVVVSPRDLHVVDQSFPSVRPSLSTEYRGVTVATYLQARSPFDLQ